MVQSEMKASGAMNYTSENTLYSLVPLVFQSPAAAALTVYPDPYTPPPTSPATSSAHFTLRYGNPYANDATVTPAPAVVKYPDTERACPEGSLDTAGGAACGDLTTPLTPLPAPLLPEVLPSAKIAAVKAVAEGNI